MFAVAIASANLRPFDRKRAGLIVSNLLTRLELRSDCFARLVPDSEEDRNSDDEVECLEEGEVWSRPIVPMPRRKLPPQPQNGRSELLAGGHTISQLCPTLTHHLPSRPLPGTADPGAWAARSSSPPHPSNTHLQGNTIPGRFSWSPDSVFHRNPRDPACLLVNQAAALPQRPLFRDSTRPTQLGVPPSIPSSLTAPTHRPTHIQAGPRPLPPIRFSFQNLPPPPDACLPHRPIDTGLSNTSGTNIVKQLHLTHSLPPRPRPVPEVYITNRPSDLILKPHTNTLPQRPQGVNLSDGSLGKSFGRSSSTPQVAQPSALTRPLPPPPIVYMDVRASDLKAVPSKKPMPITAENSRQRTPSSPIQPTSHPVTEPTHLNRKQVRDKERKENRWQERQTALRNGATVQYDNHWDVSKQRTKKGYEGLPAPKASKDRRKIKRKIILIPAGSDDPYVHFHDVTLHSMT